MDLNPQARQMADESMVRNLDAQARAIWPQEVPLLQRYELPPNASILDAGCGTGEGASRIARLFPDARVLAVDILDAHLARARSLYDDLAPRLTFENQSIFALREQTGSFDLTVCRHVLHSIPQAGAVIGELARVTRPGGYLHLIAEDYGMLHFQRGRLDPQDFWHVGPRAMERATNTDLSIGRNTFGILAALGLENIAIDYIVGRHDSRSARNVCNDYRRLARRIRRCDRRADADQPRVGDRLLQRDDCEHRRPDGLRRVDGSGRERSHTHFRDRMKALRIEEFGPLANLRVSNVEEAPLPADCVRIKIEAAGVNPSDTGVALGHFPQVTLPRILGRDFAGRVIEGRKTSSGRRFGVPAAASSD